MPDHPPPPEAPVALPWGPLFEAHPLAHFVYDTASLRLLAANQAALQRYGYTREEFLQLSRADLLLPGELSVLREFLAGLPGSATREPQHVWLEHTRDGRVLHADVRGLPVLFEGRPARLAAVVDAGMRQRLAADAAGARDLLQVAGRLAQIGGWKFDLKQQRTLWSDQVCAIHELPPGTEYGVDKALDFYPGEAALTLKAAVERCASEGTPFDLELPFVGARGTPRWVRVVGGAVRNERGRVVAIEGAQQDITQRKQDALALDESRGRLAALLRAMPDLWIVLDAESRYIEVSDEQHPSLIASWPERVGRRLAELVPPAQAALAQARIEAAHRTGAAQSLHHDTVVASGERRSFESRFVPLAGGHTMLLVRDTTDAVQLEQRFRRMSDAAPVGIFMTDNDGRVTYTNAAWQQLYGLDADSARDLGWVAPVHPEDRGLIFGAWAVAAARAQPYEAEFRITDGEGRVRRVLGHSSPIKRADGGVTGHVGTVVDVTQARELEAARRAQAVAEEAGRRQAEFLSRMSHEMRTPLNAILGFGQILQELPPGDARVAPYATHVVTAGKQMLALVEDLLVLQRLEQGRLELQAAPVDLAVLLNGCAELLRPLAEVAGAQLLVQAAPGLVLNSDTRCLRQMLLNLGVNALKHGRAAQGPSRVQLTALAQGGHVQLCVADNGPGLSAAQIERLFQPFERLDSRAGAAQGQGQGLGLVITRQLAERLGGQVWLESEPGQGTRAWLKLPPLA